MSTPARFGMLQDGIIRGSDLAKPIPPEVVFGANQQVPRSVGSLLSLETLDALLATIQSLYQFWRPGMINGLRDDWLPTGQPASPGPVYASG